ncbi:MAG: alpha/beta fold hydrolase [Aulosira sp. ZfuVER01]|nr:alpha/beta hydrolase [Aulosira sp. ZfuVER01]MDZ8000211.1 alpha/beta hydrolase [Aulosira sp. DedVER01a]MDZ8053421.1 alpha/beta hydrolase [Aulosira sp. ZfuCHP01]
MQSQVCGHSYFLAIQPSNPRNPLFVFLPGMDETGKELMYIQTAGLETAFDVHCFVIPPDDLKGWDEMTQRVAALTQLELEKAPRSSVYLCGESFGGCLALKILERFPQLFTRIILINSASSFSRVPWLTLGSLLFPLTPKFFYKFSSLISLPFLAHLNKLSSPAKEELLKSTRSAPKATANQRLSLMREFDIDQQKLAQITQPVLIVGSKSDRLLPSADEAQRLAKIFPHHQIKILPDSGHACLLESDVNLYKILISENFTR